jgi:hypothetical protein
MARVLPARGYGLTALVSQLSMGPDRLSRLSMAIGVTVSIGHNASSIGHNASPHTPRLKENDLAAA